MLLQLKTVNGKHYILASPSAPSNESKDSSNSGQLGATHVREAGMDQRLNYDLKQAKKILRVLHDEFDMDYQTLQKSNTYCCGRIVEKLLTYNKQGLDICSDNQEVLERVEKFFDCMEEMIEPKQSLIGIPKMADLMAPQMCELIEPNHHETVD